MNIISTSIYIISLIDIIDLEPTCSCTLRLKASK